MRLIIDAPAAGAWNMATDEALLDAVSAGAGPSLRFYRWSPATVSLGYFQPAASCPHFVSDDSLALCGASERVAPTARMKQWRYALVRRLTGGGAILHDDELTYSLAMPTGWPAIGGEPVRLYAVAHRAIAAALNALGVPAGFHAGPCHGNAQRGPFFCFARRHCYDLTVGGSKIVGSAQRRKRDGAAVLQHGSIILRQAGPQPCVGVNDLRPSPIAADELAELLADHFADALAARFERATLTDAELAGAATLERKYASAAWTNQR